MTNWYEKPAGGWVLRLGGLILLSASAAALLSLYRLVHASRPHDATPLELLLALIGFITASAGSVALCLGRRLFDRIVVSGRWVRRDNRD